MSDLVGAVSLPLRFATAAPSRRHRYHGRMNDNDVDILIVGGGLVGASLAIALDDCGWRVALAEAAAPRVDAQPSYDERNLALARASLNALDALGVLAQAAVQPTPIGRIHISRRGDFGHVQLDASALGLPAFGGVLSARELGNALLARLDQCRSLRRIAPAQLVAIAEHADAVEVRLNTPLGEQRLRSRLLVGADGTESFVRNHFGIGVQRHAYGQSALVTTLTTEYAMRDQAWERFTDSGPLALLPLGGHRAGLVLCVASEDAERVAALDDVDFIDLVQQRFGYRAGRLSRPGRRKPYPLNRMLADVLIAPRTVLVGNAAQTVHPLGAQGFNLGLRDALSLAECVRAAHADHSDPGAAALLHAYVDRRRADRAATTSFSDDLVHLMGNELLPVSAARSLGFLTLAGMPFLQRKVALRGMGFRGDASTLALSR